MGGGVLLYFKSSTMMTRSHPSDIINSTRFIRHKSSLSFQNPFPPEPMHLRIIRPQADQLRVEFFKKSTRLRNFVRMHRCAPQQPTPPQKGLSFHLPKEYDGISCDVIHQISDAFQILCRRGMTTLMAFMIVSMMNLLRHTDRAILQMQTSQNPQCSKSIKSVRKKVWPMTHTLRIGK
jgi:hypothetical protein